VAESADADSILADEAQSIEALKCFFMYQSPMIKLGIPAVRAVTIRPMIPNLGIKSRLSGKPMAAVIRVSFKFNLVLPWQFMRVPRLRFPNAEYR